MPAFLAAAAALLAMLLGVDHIAARRRMRHPTAVAFVVVWTVGVCIAWFTAGSAKNVTTTIHSWSPHARLMLVEVVAFTFSLGLVSLALSTGKRWSPPIGIAAAIAAAVPAVMFGIGALFYGACMADFGCL